MKNLNVVLTFTTREGEREYIWHRAEIIEVKEGENEADAINVKGVEIREEFANSDDHLSGDFYWGYCGENAHSYDKYTIIESEQSFKDIQKFI